MKFRSETNPVTNDSFFIVSITDREWKIEDSRKLSQFQNLVLTYLARMIAAYMFKKHKDEIVEMIKVSNEMVSRRLAADTLSRLGLALEV